MTNTKTFTKTKIALVVVLSMVLIASIVCLAVMTANAETSKLPYGFASNTAENWWYLSPNGYDEELTITYNGRDGDVLNFTWTLNGGVLESTDGNIALCYYFAPLQKLTNSIADYTDWSDMTSYGYFGQYIAITDDIRTNGLTVDISLDLADVVTGAYFGDSDMSASDLLNNTRSLSVGYVLLSSGSITNAGGEEVGAVSFVQTPVTPTKTGYTFTGWYVDEACTTLYSGDTITSNLTLYAGWRANTYTLVFNGNGSTSGYMSNTAMTYDVSKNLTANAYKRTGFTFQGWATSASGGVVYGDSQSVSNLTSVDGDVINLYAVWQESTYTVVFHSNNGEDTTSTQTHNVGGTKQLSSSKFTYAGHTQNGWATTPDGAKAYEKTQSVTDLGAPGSTVNLYAVWTKNILTIDYVANEGDGSSLMPNITVEYGSSITLDANKFTRAGYTFMGWSTSKNGSVVYADGASITNDITTDSSSTLKLYAVWQINVYTVTFMVDGEVWKTVYVEHGTASSEVISSAVNSALYEVLDEDGTLPNV